MAMKPWQPPDAAAIKKRWRECVEDMLSIQRSYWLNHSYFMGEQWLSWDDANARPLILDFGTNADADDRCTVNKIKPRVLSLVARATKSPLAFEPRPHGVDQESISKMHLERQVLEVTAHLDEWEVVRADVMQNCILGSVAAVSIEPGWAWDERTAEVPEAQMSATLVPGAPPTPAGKVPKRPKVKLTALSPAEFGLEPGSRSLDDARWWIRATTLTPGQAQDEYELEDEPAPDADAAPLSVMQGALTSRRAGSSTTASRACMLYVYYERPTKRGEGCVRHVIGSKVVRESPWPFKFKDRLNLALFVQTPVSGTWKGETIVNDARQLQRNYNRAWTSVNRHIGKADGAKFGMPVGSEFETEQSELTGDIEVIRYASDGGPQPGWIQPPQIPRWLREHIDKTEAELDDLFSTHAVSRGQAPGDRNSGTALAILAEKDETPLGPMATNQQRGWQRVSEMVLSTMKHLMTQVDEASAQFGGAPMQVTDVQMSEQQQPTEVTWTAADLPDDPVVHIPLDAVMPRSSVALQDMLVRLAGTFPHLFESFSPQQLAKVLQVPSPAAFATIGDAQMAQATWENTQMIAGADDDVTPIAEWHDHRKHIMCHNELRASGAYRDASPEVQLHIDFHVEAHAKLFAEAQIAAMEAQQALAPQAPAGAPQDQPAEQGVAAQ